jgi:hypothetical protein
MRRNHKRRRVANIRSTKHVHDRRLLSPTSGTAFAAKRSPTEALAALSG